MLRQPRNTWPFSHLNITQKIDEGYCKLDIKHYLPAAQLGQAEEAAQTYHLKCKAASRFQNSLFSEPSDYGSPEVLGSTDIWASDNIVMKCHVEDAALSRPLAFKLRRTCPNDALF